MKQLLHNNNSAIDLDSTTPHEFKWSIWNDIIDVSDIQSVIFNTKYQNAVLIDNDQIISPALLDAHTLTTLTQMGFIIGVDNDEKAEWERSFLQSKDDMSYLDLTILLTHDCQMQCVYCFEGTKDKGKITASTIEDILSFLHIHIGICRKLRVTWFGGEPLLAYSRLREISETLISFCSEHNIEYSADITTNGYALNSQRCNELISRLKVKRYIITLDGPSEIHDQRRPLASHRPTFGIIWRNIEMLVATGANVTLRMTIDRNNVAYIPNLLDRIADSSLRGRVGLAFCRTIDYNYTPETIVDTIYSDTEFADIEWELIKYARHLGLWRYHFPHAAPAGGCLRKGDIVIGINGEIYKCLDTIGNPQWITGHISTQSNESSQESWYESWLKWSPMNDSVCKECVLLPLCNGGCPHNSLFSDKKHGTASSCPDWKNNYRRQIKALVLEEYEQHKH